MKKEFIMLVMAEMLLVPMGNVFAGTSPASATIGYMFPNIQSVVVLGVDALSGKVLTSGEIVGYSYIPWVVVDAENLNLPLGFNLKDFFEYGCDGIRKEDLTVKILVAQAYQEEGSTEFVEGLYTDVTSDPVIRGEGTYSYKIIVTKPGEDSPLSKIETGFFGVSPLVESVNTSSVKELPVVESPVKEESLPSMDLLYGVGSLDNNYSDEDTELSTYGSSEGIDTSFWVDDGSYDFVDDGSYSITQSEWKASHPGWENSPELNSGCYKIIKDWFAEHPERTGDDFNAAMDEFSINWWKENPKGTCTRDDVFKRNIFQQEAYKGYYDVWRVQGSVNADYIKRVFDLINKERVRVGAQPLLLDQNLTKGALIRAAECNVSYDHSRPGGVYSNRLPGSGTEILVITSTTPEASVKAWINSGLHNNVLIQDFNRYVGIGQVNNSWVALFINDTYDSRYKPATDSFLKTLETSNREDDVVVNPLKVSVQFEALPISGSPLNMGQSVQCGARLRTVWYKPLANWAIITPSTLKWSSSNPSVASVNSNGLVTGLTTGQTIITGTVNDKSITYTINVSSNGTPVVPDDKPALTKYLVKYKTHVQNVGWQGFVADGSMSGTSGRGLRLEGINIALDPSVGDGIEYRTHVQNIGWQNFVSNGAMSGTEGKSYRLEGIDIKLTGAAADKYDIYYRTHVQNVGWMGWAKNGQSSGSAGFGYRLEGIEIQLVLKGGSAPGVTAGAFVQR